MLEAICIKGELLEALIKGFFFCLVEKKGCEF